MSEATPSEQLAMGWTAAQQGDYTRARALLARLRADPQLARSGNEMQANVYELEAWLTLVDTHTDEALALLRKAQVLTPERAYPRDTRSLFYARAGRPADAARALCEALAWNGDNATARFEPVLVNHLTQALRDDNAALQPLLQALFDARWTDEGQDPQFRWQRLAELQADAGQTEALQRTVARIDQPMPLLHLSIDRRFDAAMAARATPLSAEAALPAYVALLRANVQARPDQLPRVTALLTALLQAGDNTGLLEASAPFADATPAFFVHDDEALMETAWLLNLRAEAQRRLGQTDAAVATLRHAMSFGPDGHAAVGQQLNLALWLADDRQPAQALALMEELHDISEYGKSVADLVRVVAYQQLGDAAAVARATAAIAGRKGNDRDPYLHALLAQGRQDDAAAEIIRRLRSVDTRQNMLQEAQQYGDIPRWPLAAERDVLLQQLLQRGDVREAIAAVGTRGRHALYPFE
ncbi:hypothetical protein [Stenotrophomonas sp. PFBMAA-4]|uniref:hypothetical protein n=1 Tax=Stenotrophomonas sp. PFBMAA-4 TaxID=3043301 RepID=UPI0024B5AD07|nr:hypothetical protein [Stenotrophomonas sp. PFBMAA-4]MDI9275360.1 hypothetical protein [Stenotrophomonas sp. PFBMAA-4]